MLENRMVFPCTIYPQATDEYNDVRQINPIGTKCWFRDGRTLTAANFQELEGSDAMAWFPADSTITKGDTVIVDGYAYQISHVIKARRLGSDAVQFVKTWLNRFEGFVS